MPRANRYFVAGQVYHLTHRCHDGEFLLKFGRDRNDYRERLREGVAQFELDLLDYCITSNHVHLLAYAEDTAQISSFIQMTDGEFAQSFNRRKARHGAYWEDRFHSTMVEPGGHLAECLVYIALNMVRCHAVGHPCEWRWCGYHELMGLRQRFRLLNVERLLALLRGAGIETFRRNYEAMIAERIAKDAMEREPKWTEVIAVGSEGYVRQVAKWVWGRRQVEITGSGEAWALREGGSSCMRFSGAKIARNDHC
jgi:putative transposase